MNAFASHVSTLPGADEAVREAVQAVCAGLGEAEPHLAAVFATPELMDDAPRIARAVGEGLAPATLIGCTAEGVIGTAREVEHGPALSLWAASLPGTRIESFALEAQEAPDGDLVVSGWPPHLDPGAPPGLVADDAVILLADPFTFPTAVLAGPDGMGIVRDVVGGMASGGRGPGDHRLILDQRVIPSGAVGVALSGMLAVVSQGCRPVGPEMTITDGGEGVVRTLAGRPALQRVREVIEHLPPDERRLAEQGVLAGVVVDGNHADLEQGDFLVRGIVGGDPESGAIAIGGHVRTGQVMRLQVRDHHSAHSDLLSALGAARGAVGGAPGGALMFTCNGRGTRMFPAPGHDALAVNEALGDIPVAGMFCNGEFGPVCGRAQMHGFTASIAVFPV